MQVNPGARRTRDTADDSVPSKRSRKQNDQNTDPLLTTGTDSQTGTEPEEQLLKYSLESAEHASRHEVEQTAAAAAAAAAAVAQDHHHHSNDRNRDDNIAIDNALLQDKNVALPNNSHQFQLDLQNRLQNVPYGHHGDGNGPNNGSPDRQHVSMLGAGQLGDKPDIGTPEWHRIRRDSHKEVERRRRENINRGIEALSKLLPDSEKQKSLILQKAVDYIELLKAREAQSLERGALEKLIADQNLTELQNQNKQLKLELEQAWREAEHWKRACQSGTANSEESKAGNE